MSVISNWGPLDLALVAIINDPKSWNQPDHMENSK